MIVECWRRGIVKTIFKLCGQRNQVEAILSHVPEQFAIVIMLSSNRSFAFQFYLLMTSLCFLLFRWGSSFAHHDSGKAFQLANYAMHCSREWKIYLESHVYRQGYFKGKMPVIVVNDMTPVLHWTVMMITHWQLWMKDKMNKWMNEWMNELHNEWQWINDNESEYY